MSVLHSFNLNRLTVFVAVIDTGSITAAALRLTMSKTMVSTHLQRLEADLGVTLLNRTTRQVSLTEAGRAFYDAGRDVLRRAEDAIAAAQDGDTVRGILRVSTPTDFATTVLVPMLVDLRARFPDLQVELISSERRPDLIADNIDVAIHFGTLPDSTYRAATIGHFSKWLVASPAFAARFSDSLTPEGLSNVPFVGCSADQKPLSASLVNLDGDRIDVDFESGFVSDSTSACRAAILAGGGIAFLPRCSIADHIAEKKLVRVLSQWASPVENIYAVMPPSRYRGEKVRLFLEEVKARADANLARIDSLPKYEAAAA